MENYFAYEITSDTDSEIMKAKKKRADKLEKEKDSIRRIFKEEAGAHLRSRHYSVAFTSYSKLTHILRCRMKVLVFLAAMTTILTFYLLGHYTKMSGELVATLARVTRDTELMQSYLSTGRELEQSDQEQINSKGSKQRKKKKKKIKEVQFATSDKTPWSLSKELKLKKKPKRRRQEEVYTDKDRAAAVNMGTRDIKQSLKMKKKEERSKALHIPEETKSESLLALAGYEVRARRIDLAFGFINKAIDLNPEDKTALVERCKCYLLLGEPELALKDAEAALKLDPSFIKALLQKAESLYHLGKFEEALVYFHRGLKIRPDMSGFRLGVTKATEAIQNIIGSHTNAFTGCTPEKLAKLLKGMKTVDEAVAAHASEKSQSKKSLPDSLQQDKDYLETILKDKSDIINLKESFAKNETEIHAKEILTYLSGRTEFWAQQKPRGGG